MKKPQLWTKDFLIISSANLFFSLNFYLLIVIIPVFAADSFHASPAVAGLASSIFIIGGMAPRLLFGKWIERIGRKKTLFIGLVLGLATTLLYFLAGNISILLAVRFFHGAAFGIASTATGTIAANIIPEERRGEGMGYFISLSSTLSAAVGPFLGMFIVRHGSYDLIFLVCSIFAAISLAIIFFLSVPEIKLTPEQLRETGDFTLSKLLETSVIPISIVCGIIYFCYSSVLTFISGYSQEINLVEIASFFFVVFSIAILVSRPFAGRLFDAKGENIVMYPAIFIFAIGMIVLSQTRNDYTLMLAGVLIGLGLGTVQSSCQAIAINLVPRHHTGMATSTLLLCVDVAVGIGPVIFGLFVSFIGYRGMYITAAVAALACLFLYYILHGKKRKSPVSRPYSPRL